MTDPRFTAFDFGSQPSRSAFHAVAYVAHNEVARYVAAGWAPGNADTHHGAHARVMIWSGDREPVIPPVRPASWGQTHFLCRPIMGEEGTWLDSYYVEGFAYRSDAPAYGPQGAYVACGIPREMGVALACTPLRDINAALLDCCAWVETTLDCMILEMEGRRG